MAVLKIRIPDDEMACLEVLAERKARPKHRSFYPRSVFEENFLEKKSILLPEDQYQALVELVGSPLTPQEIEGRKKLKKVPDWNL